MKLGLNTSKMYMWAPSLTTEGILPVSTDNICVYKVLPTSHMSGSSELHSGELWLHLRAFMNAGKLSLSLALTSPSCYSSASNNFEHLSCCHDKETYSLGLVLFKSNPCMASSWALLSDQIGIMKFPAKLRPYIVTPKVKSTYCHVVWLVLTRDVTIWRAWHRSLLLTNSTFSRGSQWWERANALGADKASVPAT